MTALAVPDLMLALSGELSRLSAATEAFHDLILQDSRDANFIRKAQSIDFTTQALAELAEFCTNLAADAPADYRLAMGHALGLLRLGDLRDRLSNGRTDAVRPAADGALELF